MNDDINMWLLHEGDEKDVETHLKGLVYSRTKSKPHDKVNNMRDPQKYLGQHWFLPGIFQR